TSASTASGRVIVRTQISRSLSLLEASTAISFMKESHQSHYGRGERCLVRDMTRREFGRVTVVGGSAVVLGLTRSDSSAVEKPGADGRTNRSLIGGVQFGLQPFCYHDLAMTPENRATLVKRLVQNGMGMVELHATWVEPRLTAPGVSAEAAREKLRVWRV